MFQFEIDDVPSQPLQTITSEFCVGERIVCDKHIGVVRYIGTVGSHAGIWLGIEWDDLSRGKHDGTVDGVKYFDCISATATAASFLRPHKVQKTTNIISALNERYGYDEEKVMGELKKLDDRLVKMKITHSELTLLDLSQRNILELGQPQELAKLCPNIRFFSLAENLLSSWAAIAELCGSMKKLERLDLSENPIKSLVQVENYLKSFLLLDHLILGNVSYDWNDVLKLSPLWPKLSNLQLQYNRISLLSPPSITLLTLTQLDLGGNQIANWEEILKLNVLQNLEYLNLNGNKIRSISFPVNRTKNDDASSVCFFPNLIRLIISENQIGDWKSVNELDKLMKLCELRIDRNPFLEADTKINNRQITIARIEKLKKLEGVEINDIERLDAESDYIKKFSTQWSSQGSTIGFLEDHPRYSDLIKKYGEVELSANEDHSIKSQLLTLELIPEDTSLEPCQKELLPGMTVQKLRILVKKLYKRKNGQMKIELVSHRNPEVRFLLLNDFLTLAHYSIENFDKLLISW